VDHKGETGTYNVHLYYQESDGHLQGVAAKQVTLPKKNSWCQDDSSSRFLRISKYNRSKK
jgi:hypothetical protein